MAGTRKRAFAQVTGWFAGLCLCAALLFFAAQRFELAERAKTVARNMAGIGPSLVADPCERNPSSDAIVARIQYRDDEALRALLERLDIWYVEPETQRAEALVTEADQEWLSAAGFPFAQDEDLTDALPDPCSLRTRDEGQSGIPGYACYRTVDETYRDLAALAEQYPDLAEWIDIGNSWYKVRSFGLAGYDMQALVLTNRQSTDHEKGELVIMGALHARELTTAELATRFAELLLDGYGSDPDVTWLLDYNRIHIIPQANPDGRSWAEKGYLWRKNANNTNGCAFPHHGIDLNRNSSFLWNHCEGCSSGDICSVFYRGAKAASEPETRAIETYLGDVFGDQRGEDYNEPAPDDTNGIFISLHSYGRLLLYPWEHSPDPAPNRDALRRLGRKLGYFPGYRVCNSMLCLYLFDGSTTDYAYGALGVASYTFEIGTAFFQSCSYFASSVVEQNLEALVYAAKAARRPYQLPAGPDVLGASADPPSVSPGEAVSLSASANDTRSAGSGSDAEPSQNIGAARFSVGAPSWLATTFPALLPLDGTFDAPVESLAATLDTTGMQHGRHTIFLEAQDADGNWGPPSAVFIEIVPSETAPIPTETPQPAATQTAVRTPTQTAVRTPQPVATPSPTSTPRHLYLPNVWR